MAGLRKWLDMLSVRMRIFGIFGVTITPTDDFNFECFVKCGNMLLFAL